MNLSPPSNYIVTISFGNLKIREVAQFDFPHEEGLFNCAKEEEYLVEAKSASDARYQAMIIGAKHVDGSLDTFRVQVREIFKINPPF
jgi:hypothetical protein